MKQKTTNKLKGKSNIPDNPKSIALIIIGAIAIIAIFASVATPQKPLGPQDNTPSVDAGLPIDEAQDKCRLMELADRVNFNGEPYNRTTSDAADKYCFTLWDTPEKEKEFRKYIETDWEIEKTTVVGGYTLQEIYDEQQRLKETP